MKGTAPDWWGEIPRVATGLTEDRYVTALEVKEVNDVDSRSDRGRATVGGRFVYHHMIWATRVIDDKHPDQEPNALSSILFDEGVTPWPVHEVGRNADFFGPDSARLLRANSSIISDSVHLHSNGRDTKAHLEIGFKFAPKDYKPKYRAAFVALGNGVDIDIEAMQAGQQLHAYAVLQDNLKVLSFEPHLHAPGMRMCLEAIWGYNIQTLNCVGYDHNWVRGYDYTDNSAPLLPKGTIMHIIGYMDNSPSQPQRAGSAQLAGIGQPLGGEHVHRPRQPRHADRRAVPGRNGEAPRAQSGQGRVPRLPAVRRQQAGRCEVDEPAAATAAVTTAR